RYIACNERAFVPLAEVQGFLNFDRAVGPIDTLVVFENYPADVGNAADGEGAACSSLHSVSQNNYPLSLVAVPGDKLRLTLKYAPDCFDAETIEDVLGVYSHILCELGRVAETDEGALLAGIALSAPDERHNLIRIANGDERQYPSVDFAARFRELAGAYPKRNALIATEPSTVMSYAELNLAASRLANFLLGELPPASIVGLCLPRGVDQIVGMLACLKSGMPYVPLDPAYPASRLNRLIENARLAAVLTDTQHVAKVSDSQREILLLDLDAERELINAAPMTEPGVTIHPEQTAYIIYTSGSTGGPKGVSVPHRALMNYIYAVEERLMLSAEATLSHLSSVAADLGYTSVFGALGTGRCLRLLSESKSLDAPALAEELGSFPVDCLKIVPSHLIALMSAGAGRNVLPTQCLVLGGESPSKELLDSIRACAPDLRVINHYGPTETTVGVCTHGDIASEAPRTIGRPLSNMQCHVLNDLLEPAGIAAEGHLYLSGLGTSNGYLDSPRATAQAFLPNPLATTPGARMYRSGDRARYDRRGNLVFLGRRDLQIKIRGYRVEVAEIEACLRAHEGIVDAAVECKVSAGRQMLVAYLVGAGTETAVKSYLKAELPEHMQPHFMVWLAKMPLTPNGKLDRRALPAPTGRSAQSAVPKSPLELAIAEIWAAALQSGERPPADVNFFDLGGDSLSLMKVHARIAAELAAAVQITDLFTHATIAKLASFIEQLENAETTSVVDDDRAANARAALQAGRDRARQRRSNSQRDVA
ncbi:MAG TPA: amino acid adenylation domain-containing protein, partial [Steroidobacteraceae bacterium]|nr:amino acid adenylation domain-containing protein [Steroidobacteraceae bacterium]